MASHDHIENACIMVIGSEPYRGHDDGEAELDMDISRLSPSAGDGRLRRRRRITIWWGKGKGGNGGPRVGMGTAMSRASVICGWTRGQCTCFGSPKKITLIKKTCIEAHYFKITN